MQVLYGDTNALIDGSDYLGDAAKYIKLYNQLQSELKSGEVADQLMRDGDEGQLCGMSSALLPSSLTMHTGPHGMFRRLPHVPLRRQQLIIDEPFIISLFMFCDHRLLTDLIPIL